MLLTDAEIEMELYERFFLSKNLEPYPIQEEAFGHILAGRDVLVTVPTGTGKTVMAKAGILRALRTGKTAIYTTPLRALTEEKYRELAEDFGHENVGFATGDYKVNPTAPIQVLVAEILWNRIYGDRVNAPADIVIMDEGHYFNEPERGYVWEQSVIGLDPRSQLVILSATVGYPERFCQWVYLTRRIKMELVRSFERKVPLYHEFREQYLVEVVKELFANGGYPAIIFSFGREQCFEWARLLRSCPRFTTEEERVRIQEMAAAALLPSGLAPELLPLLMHGVGVHHAGILPRYKQLVEALTIEKLLKFVVSTETIAAGINLPAKRVVFPSLRKFIRGKPRLVKPAEYHQMAGRAGRPQFDTEGIALTLAPEDVIQEFRKEIKDQSRGGMRPDEEKIKKKHYMRARMDARKNEDVTWDPEIFQKIVEGQPAALTSQTRITAEQILAIGLPDLASEVLPGAAIAAEPSAPGAATPAKASGAAEEDEPAPVAPPPESELPVHQRLNIRTVIDNLLLDEKSKREAHKRLAQITRNLQALGVLDEHGSQVKGEMIGKLRGMDGPFVWYALMNHEPTYESARELVELLVDHEVIWKLMNRKEEEKKRQWVLQRLRDRRREGEQVTFDDVAEEYDREFPRELSQMELLHQTFAALVPHPELHGGKVQKKVFKDMEEKQMGFLDFVEEHELAHEEGSLFTYLARIMKAARMIFEVTAIDVFQSVERNVVRVLSVIDERILAESK